MASYLPIFKHVIFKMLDEIINTNVKGNDAIIIVFIPNHTRYDKIIPITCYF